MNPHTASNLTMPVSSGGAGTVADSALNSIFGTAGSFLNPIGLAAGILGPALGGAPSSAQGQADSGAPVNFGPIQIDGQGNTQTPTTNNSDTQNSTQVPVQPTVGVTPQYSLPPTSGVTPGSNGRSTVSPVVLGAGALAAAAGLIFLL